jgi:hypothetical protein|nr:hypothetical protein [uncultured Prevotella sp.]
MKKIEAIYKVIKILLSICLIYLVLEIAIFLKNKPKDRYSFYNGMVLDKETGKVYSVAWNKLLFEPSKK